MDPLTVSISIKDTEIFSALVKCAKGLTEIISECELSEANKEKAENIIAEFLSLTKEVES